MKKVLKGEEPPLLEAYRNNNPSHTWEQFRRGKSRRLQTQKKLQSDQAGLCAYCEIRLIEKTEEDFADFRVEHFHPKSDRTSNHNWGLDWRNLIGCCFGGNQTEVAEAPIRFTSPDHSCDVPKGKKILDNVILNPLTIPASPALFAMKRSQGQITVDVESCQSASINQDKAQATIDELKLDAQRLRRFRKTVLDELNYRLRVMTGNGQSVQQASRTLAQVLLKKDAQDRWPAFFTTIRSYLGEEAEAHLQNIQYEG